MWNINMDKSIQTSRVPVYGGRAMHCRIDSQKKVSTVTVAELEKSG